MYILGIETSCDDTAAAVIEAKGGLNNPSFSVLSNISYSQVAIHKKFGGIVPNLASRAHLEKIAPTVKTALLMSDINNEDIDLIATTRGPGLMPSLLIGVNFARAIAYSWKKPIIGVNHIEGHIYSNWLINKKIEFPALILIVSGGHTELVLMRNHDKYKIIGETLDDAAGECFDKTARILGLSYPGGPAIATEASKYKIQNTKYKIDLPRPMINSKDYNFSFSGLKTAVLYSYKGKNKSAMAYEIQEAIVDVLIAKTLKAVRNFNPKSVMIAGGVSANEKLREKMAEKIASYKIPLFVPDLSYTTDNAAMIAAAGYFSAIGGSTVGGNYLKKKTQKDSWKKTKADANLRL
ncbi:MAG: tRNA (adenosine(37)-N6)-threonylcarbamoyltransferase complex transferase subunit TsaD [Candidatus Azambacteria bacterium]|nr:tRNA (adenosine(37)-N6)-threonylcarbamoyltransferase complex transferase subunit TsaD [Candidatus Azambacteria bacterium]